MTHRSPDSSCPPRLAAWLLALLVPQDQTAPILGDLLEEFFSVASRRGIGPARRWYWRQSAKTIPHLLDAQLRLTPLRNLITVVTGLFLLWLVNMPLALRMAALPYPGNWPEPLRLAWLACLPMLPLAGIVLSALFIGWMAARLNPTREMAVTIMLGLAIAALRLISLVACGPVAEVPPAWSLFWMADPIAAVASPIAIIVGGLIARRGFTRPSETVQYNIS